MRQTIIKSNWVNLVSLAIYIGLVTTIEMVNKDLKDTNLIVNLIGNISMGVLYGLLFPIGWGLPVTLLFLLVLVTTDILIIYPLKLSLTSFFLQTLVLLTVVILLVLKFDLERIHYLYILFFTTGQYYRYRQLKKRSS